jgi:dynein heavy chain
MGPPGGGRNPLTTRFSRHFNLLYVDEFDAASQAQIFGALVDWWFARCRMGDTFQALKQPLVMASLDV